LIPLAFARRPWRALSVAVAAAAGIACGLSGIGQGVDAFLQRERWRLRSHDASGQVHIVEIDARSIAAVARWPWPRSTHARLVDRLRQAGAATIAFDIDVSARSAPSEDAALVAALRRAGGSVILPTFRQQAGNVRAGWIDALPYAEARAQSVLAAVSVRPDADGYVRRMPFATVTHGLARPSLSSMVAQANGRAFDSFAVDYGLDPASIPRHSFIDVLNGAVDPAVLRGKRVIIGATAIELGDNYAVPRYGVIPGVVVQAMAAETLIAGIPSTLAWPVPLLVALLGASAFFRLRSRRALISASVAGPVALFLLSLAGEQWWRYAVPLAPALVGFATVVLAIGSARLAAAAERRRLVDAETGLPNGTALLAQLHSRPFEAVVVARVDGIERLAAVLGLDNVGEIMLRLHDRLALGVDGAPVFRVESSLLAWPSATKETAALEDVIAGLRAMMLNPIEVRGRRADVGLHFGVADRTSGDAAQVLAFASLAAEEARAAQSGWRVHRGSDNDRLERDISLLGELEEAVRDGGLDVLYQPKLDLASDSILSVEALVRWRHPVLGPLSPDDFVPLAERHDRILPLTRYVLDRAIRDGATWRDRGHGVSIAVNLSTTLVASPDFFAAVAEAVERPGFVRGSILFEVTESAALTDPDRAVEALRRFRDMGIAVSMDDYGTGQSTLSYLQQLPLDELKIDRRFVQQVHLRSSDAVLVRSTIAMAHELGLKVVAEGVETSECLNFLRTLGCDAAQGYLIGRPVDAPAIATLLAASLSQAA
jgi:diguanylate cyclase